MNASDAPIVSLGNLPEAVVVHLCAAQHCTAEDLSVTGHLAHYKSTLTFISVSGTPDPSYVVKIEPPSKRQSRWSPEREFAGLRYIQEHLADVAGFGAIEPIACSESPAFLITRFQRGNSLRPIFDRAVRRGSERDFQVACDKISAIGRWLRAFRRSGRQADSDLTIEGIIPFCRARREEIASGQPRLGAPADRVINLMEQVLRRLTPEQCDDVIASYASHGDFAPQNFLLDGDTLYPLDLEGFQVRPLNPDLAEFRSRLEEATLIGRGSRERASILWGRLLNELAPNELERDVAFLHVMHSMITRLAWYAWERKRLGRDRGLKITSRLRTALWLRNRAGWLAGMPADPEQAVDYFVHTI